MAYIQGRNVKLYFIYCY